MKGIVEQEKHNNKRIEDLISKNSDIPCLNGYRYFIGSRSAASTVYRYLNVVKNFLRFSGKQPSELNIDDYTGYMGTLFSKTSSYQITSYTALKKFSLYLKANQMNTSDPMQYISRPKPIESLKTQEKRDNGFLNKREIRQLKNNIISGVGGYKEQKSQEKTRERDLAIVMVLLSTGMRVSALVKLDVDNIYEHDHSIRVTDKGSKNMEYFLADEAWHSLQEWLHVREKMLCGKYEDALFISSRSRRRLGRDGIVYMLERYTKNIEGKNITPHKLRATYATQLYNATKDIHFVQKCMNHSSPQTTSLYIRGQGNKTKEASEIMDKLLTF